MITDNVFIHRPLSQKKLMKIIASEYQPLNIVENGEFQIFLQMLNPNYTLPSRKTISNSVIPQLYHKVAEEVRKQVQSTSSVSITTDGWTYLRNGSYISITVHFINDSNNNCEMKSFLLDCFQYTERHTAENLSNETKRVFNE